MTTNQLSTVDFSTLREAEQSETLFINDFSKKKEAKGEKVYKFGFGQSPFFPPQHIIDVVKQQAHRKEYMSVQGLHELRVAVANFHKEVDNIDTDPDYVLIGPGSKMLIYTVMAAFKKADVFLITPSWVSYEPQAKLSGHPVTRIHTTFENRWRLTPEDLEVACKTRKQNEGPIILVLNYPGNPDGLSYSREELKALSVVFKKYGVLVISDEIYGLLNHTDDHVSLATEYPEGTIVTTGLSKWCGAGGWRLGVALVPKAFGKEFMDCVIGIASETYSTAAAPIQLAAIEAYNYDSRVKNFLTAQRAILEGLGQEITTRLIKAGVNVHRPQGAFYINPDFSPLRDKLAKKGVTNSAQLCEALLKNVSVALLPGDAFGYPEGNLVTRLAYVDFDGTAALNAYETSKKVDNAFLNAQCGKVLEGIDALINWIG